ncbi:MAG: protease modulator HflC [Alphaproteobacteria bacterium]|jgi:membrane protease subunit HflC|nr:protease modulator HflC [Alphaproteobacteria bacterium]
MNRNAIIGLGVGAALLLTALASAFTVNEAQQALVLRFGAVQRSIQQAGLYFKVPLIDSVNYIERRVLAFDVQPQELILGDRKRLVVDSFARYRIVDPELFYQRARTEAALQGQMQPILNSAMRNVLGEVPLFTVLSANRDELMNRIEGRANQAMANFGVDVVDVRMKRADLPEENSQAIFRRMRSEREREARELRAQGEELAARIRARADRERAVLLAEARRDSEILRGEGDAEAVKIFADAFGRDPDFFGFYRSMQAYRNALGAESTQFVMSPSTEFFRYFDRGALQAVVRGGQDPVVPEEAPGDTEARAPAPNGAGDDAAGGDDQALLNRLRDEAAQTVLQGEANAAGEASAER